MKLAAIFMLCYMVVALARNAVGNYRKMRENERRIYKAARK